MTTKIKAAKPAVVNNIVAKPEHIALAKTAGSSASAMSTMRAAVNEACQSLHKAKAKIGDQRNCELAKAFLAERFKNKAAKPAVKSQILSCFRKAVESGKEYNENASRAKAKAVTKQDAPKDADADKTKVKDDETTIILAMPRKSTAKQAAKQMRAFVEKMRQSESLAPLAAYFVDVLDEFDGTAEQY